MGNSTLAQGNALGMKKGALLRHKYPIEKSIISFGAIQKTDV
jgi:hypothetical protein